MTTPPFIRGPGADYRPREGDHEVPEHLRENVRSRGRTAVLAALAARGIRKTCDGHWNVDPDDGQGDDDRT